MKKTIGIGAAVLVLAMLLMLAAILYLYVLTSGDNREKQPAQSATPAPEQDGYVSRGDDDGDVYNPDAAKTDDMVFYDGAFELPLNGSTGFAAKKMNILASPGSGAGSLMELAAGAGFLILQEADDWWEVQKDGVTGWVRHKDCFINLPDIIPSIRYNCTNANNSRFNMPGSSIPGITGETLYFGRTFNERLNKEEYICGVMYSMAGKIQKAQRNALAEGDSIVVYEAFRPYSVQRKVAAAMSDLISTDTTLNRLINSGGWELTWFISTGISNHQRGGAMDVGLLNLTNTEYAETGGYSYLQIISPNYYEMPTPIHELSINAVTYTSPGSTTLSQGMKDYPAAVKLQRFCTDAGLSPLASEWWHFNDQETLNAIGGSVGGDFILTECYSIPPVPVE